MTAGGKAKADKKGVVVYLENVPGTPPTPKDHAIIRQREKQFEPPLTIVVKGTTVDFPNEDKIFHNVFSVSRPARFDLGLYKSGTAKSVEMKRAGTVDVYCNIHPDMIAKVKVLDNALLHDHRRATATFTIDSVPPGRVSGRRVAADGDEAKGTVTVKAGAVGRREARGHRGREEGDAHAKGRHAIRSLQVIASLVLVARASRRAKQAPPAKHDARGRRRSRCAMPRLRRCGRCDAERKVFVTGAGRCGECHEKMFDEWEVSAHAMAVSSPLYKAAVASREGRDAAIAATRRSRSVAPRDMRRERRRDLRCLPHAARAEADAEGGSSGSPSTTW